MEEVERMVNIGGLFRCCLDRDKEEWEDPKHKDGDRLPCPHGCGSHVILDDAVWRWDKRAIFALQFEQGVNHDG